ncbi:alpha/beta fold hydrolase [Amycolatopsis sp. FDAARGOS 1241]|uniref:alpha/beta fold hydrolase n=1 Tax=Amycolatopsis sp. FDAARGOS 1241 TaxID=2778070 RepID=UPI001952110D|nr:alpha/beta fold hydrolase [Amycolatopsis sp. FDAARGOS 1241]QRP45207.1 alpha/beta fold hydrolase [Amycolatopsis sp. FDAARGOS 1241]
MTRRVTGTVVDVDGIALHLCEDGPADAPAVLLVHGFSGSLHSWDRLTPLLSGRHRVLRADLRGHGCTGGHTGLDARSQATTLAAALKLAGAGRVTAVGHSFGADVVLELAALSAIVDRIVLIGQAPDYSLATFPPGNGLLAVPFVGRLLHRLAGAAPVELALRPTRLRQAHADFCVTSPAMAQAVLIERRRLLTTRPLDAQVAALGLPTLAILGRRDRLYDQASAAVRYRAAGARVEVLDAGHTPFTDRPDEVAALVEHFAREG